MFTGSIYAWRGQLKGGLCCWCATDEERDHAGYGANPKAEVARIYESYMYQNHTLREWKSLRSTTKFSYLSRKNGHTLLICSTSPYTTLNSLKPLRGLSHSQILFLDLHWYIAIIDLSPYQISLL